MTEIEDMEQEILDTEEFNYHVESTIGRYKEIPEEGNSTQRLVSEHTQASSHPISVLNQNPNQPIKMSHISVQYNIYVQFLQQTTKIRLAEI